MAFAADSDFTAIPRWSMVNIVLFQSTSMEARVPSPERGPNRTGVEHPSLYRFNSLLSHCADNFLHQGIRIAFMLGDFGRVTGHVSVSYLLACFLQQRVAQHLDQPFLPVLNITLEDQVFLLQISFILANSRGQFLDSCSLGRHRFHNRGR